MATSTETIELRQRDNAGVVENESSEGLVPEPQQTWNLHRFLSPWFRSVQEFRCILARSGAVVAGSQVLRYFDRDKPLLNSDLDIVTRIGGALPIASYLISNGYNRAFLRPSLHYGPDPVETDVLGITASRTYRKGGGKSGIFQIMDFVKRTIADSGEVSKHVQVIVVAQDPVEHICFSYHSSKRPICSKYLKFRTKYI